MKPPSYDLSTPHGVQAAMDDLARNGDKYPSALRRELEAAIQEAADKLGVRSYKHAGRAKMRGDAENAKEDRGETPAVEKAEGGSDMAAGGSGRSVLNEKPKGPGVRSVRSYHDQANNG